MRRTCLILLLLVCHINLFAQKEIKSIESKAGKIYYETEGAGDAVLLLSGGPGAAPGYFHPVMDYLSKGYKTILLHQRGTGMSSNATTDVNTIMLGAFVSDISAILKQEGIGSAFLVGHSWGAMLALDFMVKNRDKVKGALLMGAPGATNNFRIPVENDPRGIE